jgi:hypothetical protein
MSQKILLAFCLLFIAACGANQDEIPPFADLTFSTDFAHISSPDQRSWEVTFEKPRTSTFTGVVRHISRWDDSTVPFMTHDILVTTGDYSSQGLVDTFVINHKFIYHYKSAAPEGTINLLHVFPASEEIYRQLLNVKDWNQVSIRGREILKIDLYDAEGQNKGYFTDMGCNTILVTSVKVKAQGTPIP